MIMNDVFESLKHHDLVDSHVEFSERWLRKSPRYMSMLRASGREPSLDAIVHLLANLKLHRDTYRQSQLPFLTERADAIDPIMKTVNASLLSAATTRDRT